jgi:uncharacterized protein (TIGR00304 family)
VNTLLMFFGLLLIVAGLIVLFSSQKKPHVDDLAAQKEPEKDIQIKGGAVIMIGPIPIVMGSDSKTALIMMLIALAIMMIWAIGFRG